MVASNLERRRLRPVERPGMVCRVSSVEDYVGRTEQNGRQHDTFLPLAGNSSSYLLLP
jgi:hypothetical protein